MKNYKKVPPDTIRKDGLEIIFLGRDPDRDAYRIKVRRMNIDGQYIGIIYLLRESDFWLTPDGAAYTQRTIRGERDE